MYDSILVPVDGSDPSDAAVSHACAVASDEATVHLLHAVEYPERGTLGGHIPDSLVEAMHDEGERLVADAAARVEAAGLDAEATVVDGAAIRAIADYADNHDVDVLVMGTHGRRGVERFLLGSTTERTIRTVDRPVLTVESPP